MPPSRHLLLTALLATSTALVAPARAQDASYPEVGGWGQAWGEDERPRAAPLPTRQRPTAPMPALMAPTTPAAPIAAPPPAPVSRRIEAQNLDETGMGQPYPEVGGWGQAWGEDEPAAAPPPRRPAATEPLPGLAAQPAAPQPPPAPTPAPTPARRAEAAPTATPALAAEDKPVQRLPRATITPRGEPAEISGDAVGLRRPPRITPKALSAALREEEGDAPPLRMEADQVIYDKARSVVTAKGKVEMLQSGRMITADSVTYDLKQDLMGASGNVTLSEPGGEITHADYFELTGDFKSGVAEKLRLILADNSRLWADKATRSGGDRTDLDYGVYTACEPCRDDPDRRPLWAAKAVRVTHNQAEAQIEYRDAWVEFMGVPFIYTPYLSHPDPTVKRKSGLLAPSVGYNSTLGPSFTTPYFYVMSDHEDLTLSPRFMFPKTDPTVVSKADANDLANSAMQHLHLLGEHRWRGVYGESKTQASITADKSTGDIRGHVESKGTVDLDQTWRVGWQAQYQSDEVYRSLYRVRSDNDRPWLLTRPYVEGFGRRNYAMAEAMSFQGRRLTSDTAKSPVVLPHIIYQSISDPGWGGSYWTFDSDALAYTRTQGTIAQRLSQRAAWTLPVITPDGQSLTVTASARGDGYRSERAIGRTGEITDGRAIPEISANWRYPFARVGSSLSQVIEPVAMVAMSPVGGNHADIPNEDSLAFELDETNVMRPNRLVGLDRVEGGLRGGYGLRWSGYPARGGRIGVHLAQGWRRHLDSTFSETSGFTDTFSDYLGRVDVTPNGALNLSSRFRLDRVSMDMRRNETTVTVGPPALNFSTAYGYLSTVSSSAGQIYPSRQYLTYSVASAMSQYWKSAASLSQDLGKDGGTVNWTASASYNDECFAIVASMNRYYSTTPGLLTGYNAMLTFVLKTLGEAPVGLF